MSGPRASSASPSSGLITKEILATVQQLLGRHVGRARPVVAFEHRPSSYRTSFALEEVDVRLDDGRELRLMLKDVGLRAMSAVARAAKPAFLLDPSREILTYRHLLSQVAGPPAFYGAQVDPPRKRYVLLIERVDGLPLWQVGDLKVWQEAARWLVGLHRHFSDRACRPRPSGYLLVYDAAYYGRWLRRALAFADGHDPTQRRAIGRIADRYDRVVECLMALQTTLIHGELYASNVLVQETGEGIRVAPVDWEMAALGPGLVDLAALVAGGWSDDQRRAIARAYFEALAPGHVWSWDDFLRALDCCRLHLAIQWLGWSSDWSPPPEHAQDWLGEAARLAEGLGL